MPNPGVTAEGIQPSTDHRRRVETCRSQQHRHHRADRRLAVSPGDGDALLELHQLGQHPGTRNHLQIEPASLDDFRIVGLNGRRSDNQMAAVDVSGVVARVDGSPQTCETVRKWGQVKIRSAYRISQGQQDLGDAAHTDAADPDEVDLLLSFSQACQAPG